MSMREQLENDLHESMRARDELRKDTIRMILSSLKMAEIEAQKPMDDQGILNTIQKELKIRKETIKELESANRGDLVDKAVAEIAILEKYLPRQMSDEEISLLARSAIAETGATKIADMGKVMKILLSKVTGVATPDRVSAIVKQLLS